MGNWNITIEGVGPHHNDRDFDADFMAKAFVKALKDAGHIIRYASFVHGAATDIAFRQVTEEEWNELQTNL